MAMVLTDEQVKEIIRIYRTDPTSTNKKLAEKFNVTEATIGSYTKGLEHDEPTADDESHEEKIEKQLHIEYLQELKDAGITPKLAARGLKKMFDSPDLQDIKEAVKEYHKVSGVYAKERTGPKNDGNNVNRMTYNLRMPKRDEAK